MLSEYWAFQKIENNSQLKNGGAHLNMPKATFVFENILTCLRPQKALLQVI